MIGAYAKRQKPPLTWIGIINRFGISPATYSRMKAGVKGVSMGTYSMVMEVLDAEKKQAPEEKKSESKKK